MDVWSHILRTGIIYLFVFFVMRIMGKREIGKLSVFDLVISIMIAEIAVLVIEDIDEPMTHGLIPIATLVTIQLAIAFISLKSQTIRRLFEGRASAIISNGKLNQKEMRKQRYNLDDLLLQLRENKVTNVADVEFALLEPSGKLSVVKKQDFDKDKEKDHETNHISYEGLPLPLIMDGKVQNENLTKIGKTRFWLKNQIQLKGVSDFKEVYFCSIDHRGKMFLDRRK
ncbi:MAG TPA: DUF421 domain-containing protein [Bacilli bacterium]